MDVLNDLDSLNSEQKNLNQKNLNQENLTQEIYAVVIASGKSRRMQKNKLLMRLKDRPMADYAMQLATLPVFEQSYVVTCYPEIEALAKARDMSVIWNSESDKGQSRSVVLGAKAVSDASASLQDCSGTEAAKTDYAVMFFNGDMPYLKQNTVMELVKAYKATGKIIVPMYGKRPGNPVLFPGHYIPELMALTGDVGGRTVIKAHPEAVAYILISDAREGMDLDDEISFREAEAYFNEHQ